MMRLGFIAAMLACMVVQSSAIAAQELATYRDLRLGTSPDDIARQTGITAAPRVVHSRPQLIEELTWWPERRLSSPNPSGESLRQVVFSFYNGQLFRMVVNYDWGQTEGMTADDVLEALSATYGTPLLPATALGERSEAPASADVVLAHWEDASHSVDLFRPSYAATFGLAIVLKEIDELAKAAAAESVRLDLASAPQRASELQQKHEAEERARQERVRTTNKARFRP